MEGSDLTMERDYGGSDLTMERDYGGEWPDYGEGLWRGVTRLWRE